MSRLKRVSFILFGVLLASCASQVSVSPKAQPNAGLTPATFCTAVRPPSPEPGLLTVIEKGQDQQRLACLLDQLDEDRQELLRLRFSGGLSFSEISALDLHPSQPLDQIGRYWRPPPIGSPGFCAINRYARVASTRGTSCGVAASSKMATTATSRSSNSIDFQNE